MVLALTVVSELQNVAAGGCCWFLSPCPVLYGRLCVALDALDRFFHQSTFVLSNCTGGAWSVEALANLEQDSQTE